MATKIRFEDLGEPVQKLFRSLHGGKGGENVSDEDMSLLEYISVKDMVKIFQEMSTDRHADVIWEELKAALIARREKAERKRGDMDARARDLDAERIQAETDAANLAAEQAAAAAEAEKLRRRAERKRQKALEAAAAAAEEERIALEAQAAAEEEEEAARIAEEEAAAKKREDKRKRREEKARRIQEEAEALQQERTADNESRKRKRDQKREWTDYVASHPLDFAAPAPISMVMKEKESAYTPMALADLALLNRTYTAQCPSCNAKYSKPPPEWDCPMCLRKFRQHIKCWQPDDVSECMCCKSSVGRFSRHHCRNCGRIVCGKCSEFKVTIPSLGYKDAPVKACIDCMTQLAPAAVQAAQAKKA